MASYQLTVNIDDGMVGKLNDGKYMLCFSRGVSDAGTSNAMSVIAYCDTAGDTVTISWTDSYEIGATKNEFSSGAQFQVSDTYLPISFGQTYNLPENWSDAQVSADSKIPQNAFGFQNAVEASCAIQEQINGSMVPVYISPLGNLIPGKDVLTPTPTVAVWFQQSVTTGTMISLDTSQALIIDYTNPAPKTCTYDASGVWSLKTPQIVYDKPGQKAGGSKKVPGIGSGLGRAVKA